jgi:two-component system, NtrC family, response regulator PilR
VKRILLVEDDADVRFIVEHVLLAEGYGVDVAATAAVARRALGAQAYDLVLADGKLGDGTGFEIADLGAARGAKTLVITGDALAFPQTDRERHPYLMKPVRAAELVRIVAELIGAPKSG